MAALNAFTSLPGVPKDQERSLIVALNKLVDAVNESAREQIVTPVQSTSFNARLWDIVRMSAGGQLSLPPANASTASKRVGLFIEGSGSVRVSAQSATLAGGLARGTVNGSTADDVQGPGYCEFVSNGAGGWASTSSSESGAASSLLADVEAEGVPLNSIDNTMLQDMPQATVKGRPLTAGAGDPRNLTRTELTALLNVFTAALQGAVPLSGGGTANFLRADVTWATPPIGASAADLALVRTLAWWGV